MDKPKNKLFRDLTSQIFGRWTVLEYSGPRWPDKKSKGHQWKCKCECGTEGIVLGSSLVSGGSTSCGCYHQEVGSHRLGDVTGQKFGKLTAVEVVGRKNNQGLWRCVCECGQETEVIVANLKHGRTQSCGCRKGNFIHGMTGKPGYKAFYLKDPSKKLKHNVSVMVRTMIKGEKNGATFDYLPYTVQQLREHLESLWEPWMNWSNYGGKNDDPRMTWHIDHIVPQANFHYTSLNDPLFLECWSLSNLRTLEKKANMAKGAKGNFNESAI